LINALVGEKIAITSTRPQTTRRIIRGVISRPQGQLILVDTPGLHRPRTLLGERLNAIVAEAYSDVDLIACCLPANESSGSGDERIISEITGKIPLIAIVTKSDSVPRDGKRSFRSQHAKAIRLKSCANFSSPTFQPVQLFTQIIKLMKMMITWSLLN
jgi:small GTP-binding protein